MLTFILLCLLVGAIVGFLAGLFGIGGGLVIVPTLVYLLQAKAKWQVNDGKLSYDFTDRLFKTAHSVT